MKCFLLLFCITSKYAYAQPSHCDLKKQADGVKVYTCKSEHEKFKTVKAEFVLENTPIVE